MSRLMTFFILGCVLFVFGAQRVTAYTLKAPYIVQCQPAYYYTTVYPDQDLNQKTIIRSSNYGHGNYSNNEACIIHIVTGTRPLTLKFKFRRFNLENSDPCYWDSLCMHGYHFCGRTLENMTVAFSVPASNSLTLKFYSNDHVTSYGFEIEMKASVATNPRNEYYEDGCFTAETTTPFYDYTDPYTTEEPTPTDYGNYENPSNVEYC